MGIKQEITVNLYMFALKQVLRRMLWDIKPESYRSRKALKLMKDKYAGETAVIMCNGPSLLKVDFSALSNVYVFGLNKINLLFDKTEFRPDFIVSINPLVNDQNKEFFNSTDIPLFLDHAALATISNTNDNVHYLHSTILPSFARDVSMSVYQGYTVTYVAMQLAFHMGFSRVALVGCDHNFATKGPANQAVISEGADESHFDPRYFSGVTWQLPDLIQSEISYLMALDAFQMDGRSLYNATDGGKLEVLPRISLIEFLADVKPNGK